MSIYLTRGPHGMGDRLGPSGLLKASLNESNRQQIHQNVKCYIIHWNLYTKRVSKPSIFLTSYLLNFLSSQLLSFPLDPPQKLFIEFFCYEVVFIFVYLCVTSWLINSVSPVTSVAKKSWCLSALVAKYSKEMKYG
jgi:hypothetical protein